MEADGTTILVENPICIVHAQEFQDWMDSDDPQKPDYLLGFEGDGNVYGIRPIAD